MTFDNSFLKNVGNRQNDNNHVCFYICVYPRGCQRSQVTKGVQFTGGTRRKNEAEVRESGVSLHEVKGKPSAREGLRSPSDCVLSLQGAFAEEFQQGKELERERERSQ